jgi:tetratricopeptide (TPR) repeat protein
MGDAAALAEAVSLLRTVAEDLPADHSPLDSARIDHTLGLALQALGEACEEEALFDRAIEAFAPALDALDAQPMLPFRSVVAHDAAACVARRAERRGDLPALERAEAAFRDALKSHSAEKDPLSWAVTQVALARIYEAEADLRGDTGERADAAFALASALEVFSERGLRSLSESTLTALERVRPG